MSVTRINDVYANVKTKNNFGKVHAVLKGSNYENLLNMTTDVDILKDKLGSSDDVKKISKKEEFYHLLSYIFQSLTNIGYTTYEILSFISEATKDPALSDKEVMNFLSSSFCFVHTDYEKTSLWRNNKKVLKKILFGHDNVDHFNMGLVFGNNSSIVIGKEKRFKRDIKTLSSFTGVTNSNNTQTENYNNLVESFDNCSLNKSPANPSKSKTSVSSILITDPRIRVGTQNELELSTFFNGITTLEMNRSYPYVNATFILPTLSSQKKVKEGVYKISGKSSTISSFLFSGDNKTKNYNDLGGDQVNIGVRKTNMSIFTSPQTLVNFDEPIGHNQNHPTNARRNTVNDPTQPFMSITAFNINTAPTKGLMSYKTGTLNVILHDRTRMPEIAPFVKPDILGSFGAEIIMEYGWSNPDQDNEKNPMGYFIGNSRIVEKYMIVNSSLTVDNSGQVNISLSLAMKGPHEFKNQKISTRISGRVEKDEFLKKIAEVNHNRLMITSSSNQYLERYNLSSDSYIDIFNENARITPDTKKSLNSFADLHNILYNKIQNNLKNYIDVNLLEEGSKFEITVKGLTDEEHLTTLALMLSTLSIEDIKKNITGSSITLNYENKNSLTKQEIFFYINQIYNSTMEAAQLIDYIKRQDKKEGDNERKIIETIMGSAQYIDHFYPTDEKLYPKENPERYVSFGSVVNTIVQSFIANKGNNFDEIQTVFYNANQYAAKMSNRNIANFLIPRKLLSNLLEDIFKNNTVITPESLISQIILKCIKRKDNISLGLTSLYENNKNDPLKPLEIKQDIKDADSFLPERNKKLREIYGIDAKGQINSNFKNEDLKFILPVIHMNFDCLTSNSIESSSKERTILRISIFDKADSPFHSSSEILENVYSGKIDKVIGSLIENRKDFNNKRKDKKYDRPSIMKFNERHKDEIKRLIKADLIKNTKNGYRINKEIFNSNNGKFIGDVKAVYKKIYPSLTYGTQNSIMTSANVSTINDNKLGTIFITRADRNDQNLINNRVDEEMPLLIMPTQASVEIFGCPWVNFGQSIFLDFETGTTLDNKYVVTGITHNLSPGKFTTQLTLTYGDNYGQLRSAEEMLNDSVNHSKPKKRKKPPLRVGKSGEELRIKINPDYTKSSNYIDGMSVPRLEK